VEPRARWSSPGGDLRGVSKEPVLAEKQSDRVEARRLWKMVLDACPGDAEAMARGERPDALRVSPAPKRQRP
jgi:hypothetical protein